VSGLSSTAHAKRAGENLHSVVFRADWTAEPYVRRVGWFRWEGWLIRRTRGIRVWNAGRSGQSFADPRDAYESSRIGAIRTGRSKGAVLARLDEDTVLVAEAYEALRQSTVHVHTTAPDGGLS
jgi:hypothetical protein